MISWKYKCKRRPERKTGKWWGHEKEKGALQLKSSPTLASTEARSSCSTVSLQVEDATTHPCMALVASASRHPSFASFITEEREKKGFPFEMQLESPRRGTDKWLHLRELINCPLLLPVSLTGHVLFSAVLLEKPRALLLGVTFLNMS